MFKFITHAWATANLDEAAFYGDIKKMKDELAKGGDPNHRHTPHGLAPLHRLCQPNRTADRIEIAKLLLEHGTTIDIRSIARGSTPADVGGQTPLDLAAFNSCLELATFFLSRGADVHARDDRDYTPLHFAAVGGDIKLAELLLEHGANPTAVASDGKNPLTVAKDEGKTEMVAFLNKIVL